MESHKIKRQLSAAYEYSFVRLALNFYMYDEMFWEETNLPNPLINFTQELIPLLKDMISEKASIESLISLRSKSMNMMEVITAYVDCFQIYEYVLNRLENKFHPVNVVLVSDIEEIVSDLMSFIEDSAEKNLMSNKIQMILGQLPVRLTKQKFFQMLSDSLSIYEGIEKQSYLNRLYCLRTESMVQLPVQMDVEYHDIYQILDQFRQTDFKNIDLQRYDDLVDQLQQVSEILLHDSNLYLLLQEMINDCYVILLCQDYSFMDAKVKAILQEMITKLCEKQDQQGSSNANQGIEPYLTRLEGLQESAIERYLRYGDIQYEKSTLAEICWKVDRLISDSPFVDVEKCEYNDEIASKAWVEQMTEQFCSELVELFNQSQQPVIRSIMAKVLSGINVPFKSLDELEHYLQNSLEACADLSEREISIQLLKNLMVDEYELV